MQRRVTVGEFQNGKNEPPPPRFFGTAHSKGVAGESRVSAHSTRLKVAVFSTSWGWLVSADSKEVTGWFCLL